jgi:hypothetical protein
MRFALVLALLGLSLPAAAQSQGEQMKLLEEVDSKRFPTDGTPGPTFQKGDLVTVLWVEGDRLRVFRGNRFGWIPADKVEPAPQSTPPGLQGLPPGFKLGN